MYTYILYSIISNVWLKKRIFFQTVIVIIHFIWVDVNAHTAKSYICINGSCYIMLQIFPNTIDLNKPSHVRPAGQGSCMNRTYSKSKHVTVLVKRLFNLSVSYDKLFLISKVYLRSAISAIIHSILVLCLNDKDRIHRHNSTDNTFPGRSLNVIICIYFNLRPM